MNPSLAWHSEIFRTYVYILLSVLAGAGGLLAFLTWGLGKNTRSIWITYSSWLWMAPVGMCAVLLGRVPTILLFVLLSIFAFKEFSRATGLKHDRWMSGAVYLMIFAGGVTAILAAGTDGVGHFSLFLSLPLYATAILLSIPILRDRAAGQLQAMALALFGFISIGWMFLHLMFLAQRPDTRGHLLFLVIAVQFNDIAAFTFGRIFGGSGGHPLRKHLSPKKTWEGALGALAVSMFLPWMMRFSFPLFGPAQLLLTGLIIGIAAPIGDLAISVIKRDLGLKDMGTAIPGHGGVLDRIDSLLLTAPLFTHMVNFYYRYW